MSTFGGLVFLKIFIWSLLIHFLDFLNFRGSFFSIFFFKFQNYIENQNVHFWGVCFLQLFHWSTPYRCFCWFSSTFHQVSLVPLFTTRGVVAPPENDPIMSDTSIQLFRHLEHQNLFTNDWVIDSWSGRKIRDGAHRSSSSTEQCQYYIRIQISIDYHFSNRKKLVYQSLCK